MVSIQGERSNQIVSSALEMLEDMEHRGATGSDAETGNGAGILIQISHERYQLDIPQLLERGRYGVVMLIFPHHEAIRMQCKAVISAGIQRMSFELIAYRAMPIDKFAIVHEALSVELH